MEQKRKCSDPCCISEAEGEGTAEDYIDILKNLGIYATKIEVDSKIEDWHNTHFVMLSEEEYENLQIKDSNTLYFLYEDDFIIEPASEGGAG